MDSAVKIEPRYENPDGKLQPGATETIPTGPPATASNTPAVMTMPWVYQNGYLLAGLGLMIILICFGIFWFRQPAVRSSPAQPNGNVSHVHTPPSQPATHPPAEPPTQLPTQSPDNQDTKPPTVDVSPGTIPAPVPAPQMTAESIKSKLDALKAVRQQSERQPIVEVQQNDLDALMEDPSKKPEQQDLSIGALI